MIIAIVKARIVPEKVDELREIANILQNDFAPKERGCEQYESFIDGDIFITIERWLDQESLDIHLKQEHVKIYVPKMKACIKDGLFDVTFIESSNITFMKI